MSSSLRCFLLNRRIQWNNTQKIHVYVLEIWCDDTQPRKLLSMRRSNRNTNISSAESLLGAGRRLQNKGLAGGGLRWKGRKRRKKKDVPSALMRRLQRSSCSLQKEERDRANKQWPPDSAHLLQLPLPTWMKAEGGCRWSYTNTYGLCTHGPSTVIRIRLEQILVDIFKFPDYRYGDVITAITKAHF